MRRRVVNAAPGRRVRSAGKFIRARALQVAQPRRPFVGAALRQPYSAGDTQD